MFYEQMIAKPSELHLNKEFFGNELSDFDVKCHMLYGNSNGADIISQYVQFSQIYDKELRIRKQAKTAAGAAIEICKNQNILTDYLVKHENDIIRILTSSYHFEQGVIEDILVDD